MNQLPRDLRSLIGEYAANDPYAARGLDFECAELFDEIQRLGLNPVDFIWRSINAERRRQEQETCLAELPPLRIFELISSYSWQLRLDPTDNGYSVIILTVNGTPNLQPLLERLGLQPSTSAIYRQSYIQRLLHNQSVYYFQLPSACARLFRDRLIGYYQTVHDFDPYSQTYYADEAT